MFLKRILDYLTIAGIFTLQANSQCTNPSLGCQNTECISTIWNNLQCGFSYVYNLLDSAYTLGMAFESTSAMADITETGQGLDNVTSSLATCSSSLTQLINNIIAASSAGSSSSSVTSALENAAIEISNINLDVCKCQFQELNNSIQAQADIIGDLEDDIADLSETLTEVKDNITILNTTAASLKDDIGSCEEDLAELNNTAVECKEDLAILEEILNGFEDQAQECSDDVGDLLSISQATNTDIGELNAILEVITENACDCADDIAALNATAQTNIEAINDIEACIAELEEAAQNCSDLVRRINETISNITSDLWCRENGGRLCPVNGACYYYYEIFEIPHYDLARQKCEELGGELMNPPADASVFEECLLWARQLYGRYWVSGEENGSQTCYSVERGSNNNVNFVRMSRNDSCVAVNSKAFTVCEFPPPP